MVRATQLRMYPVPKLLICPAAGSSVIKRGICLLAGVPFESFFDQTLTCG